MSIERSYTEDSPAVQVHLGIVQSVIQRMASNSTSSKTWCIALVSAILVIVADKDNSNYVLFAAIPTVLFLFLDTYYLALEKAFRESYNTFVEKLHNDRIITADLYAVTPTGWLTKTFFRSFLSFSIWPFYLTIGVMIWLAHCIVIT